MPESAPRPSQVTVAAWLVMAGSVVVVLTAFDQIAGLHTIETREAVEAFLDDDLGRSFGLDVQGALGLMRVLTMVAAACATAAGILGYQVLQRSRSARLVLTVLAGPLFVTGVVVGGLVPAMVAGAIVMLWFQPARDWVDGKTPPPVPALPPVPSTTTGFGDRRSLLDSLPPPTAPAPARPRALVWACVLAWVGSGLACLVMLAAVVVVLASPDLLVDEILRQNPSFEDEGLTADTVRATVLSVGSVLVMWSAAAMVLAAYAWAGRPWARTALLGSSVSAAALCLLGALTNPLLLMMLGLCVATTVLLARAEVRGFVNRPESSAKPRGR